MPPTAIVLARRLLDSLQSEGDQPLAVSAAASSSGGSGLSALLFAGICMGLAAMFVVVALSVMWAVSAGGRWGLGLAWLDLDCAGDLMALLWLPSRPPRPFPPAIYRLQQRRNRVAAARQGPSPRAGARLPGGSPHAALRAPLLPDESQDPGLNDWFAA